MDDETRYWIAQEVAESKQLDQSAQFFYHRFLHGFAFTEDITDPARIRFLIFNSNLPLEELVYVVRFFRKL